MTVSIIGIDLAMSVFQLHGVEADGLIIDRGRPNLKRTNRSILACSVSIKSQSYPDPARTAVETWLLRL